MDKVKDFLFSLDLYCFTNKLKFKVSENNTFEISNDTDCLKLNMIIDDTQVSNLNNNKYLIDGQLRMEAKSTNQDFMNKYLPLVYQIAKDTLK